MPLIQSVERALQILDLFDEYSKELKISEISEKMGLHKSTVHSLLKTLQKYHYIEQDRETSKYSLGFKIVERGNYVIDKIDIRQKARGYLVELSKKTGQTTHLAILNGKEGVYIDKVEGVNAVIRFSRIGKGFPLHSTAVGKVLLGFQNLEEVEQIISDYSFTKQTSFSIEDKEAFLKELERVKEQGYAVDSQENELGVRCIAVPVQNFENKVIAAISISTLISRVDDEKLDEYINLLKQTCLELSNKMGYGSRTIGR
jgi:DNA-binding IclR family transcriptional regulator